MFDSLKKIYLDTTKSGMVAGEYYAYFTFCGIPYKKVLSHTFTEQSMNKILYRQFDLLTGRSTIEGFYNKKHQQVGRWISYDHNNRVASITVYDDEGKYISSDFYQRDPLTGKIKTIVRKGKNFLVTHFYDDGVIDYTKIKTKNEELLLEYMDGHLWNKARYNKKTGTTTVYFYDLNAEKKSITTVMKSGAQITRFFKEKPGYLYKKGKFSCSGTKEQVYSAFVSDLKKDKLNDKNRQLKIGFLSLCHNLKEKKELLSFINEEKRQRD